jgi:hypothetical protein
VRVPRWGRRRTVRGALVAAFLALALSVSPPATRTAVAAGALRVDGAATYTLDPEAGRVHVAIDFDVTDLKPNTATTIYYYTGFTFGVQEDARSVRATDGQGPLSVTTRARRRFTEVVVNFRTFLYFRDRASFTVRYDLVGAGPRAESPIRVGRAFSSFGVWAWGDAGRSSLEVRIPAGFETKVDGGPLGKEDAASGVRLTADPADPDSFFAIVSADAPSAYHSTRISLAGGVEIVVLSWPEDRAWDDATGDTLRAALPKLRELIGLDWPVEHDLEVRERYTPALEGYAGVFFTDDQRIEISEDLDPLVAVHEASHAWFNGDLFAERWIYEGLAEEYAWRVLTALGDDAGDEAAPPDPEDPGFVALNEWTFPRVIRDEETDDRERYGYEAAYWVLDLMADAAGLEGMATAFAAADANRTAYPGAGEPESVPVPDTWRRLLDLVEGPDKPELDAVEAAMRDLVVRDSEVHELADRRAARAAYRALLDRGDGWLAPWYVREPMGQWRFDDATARIGEAEAVLDLRARVDAAAAALGLQPDDALRTAYEGATETLDGATSIGQANADALTAIDAARASLAAPADLASTIGLLGQDPNAPYVAARAAFERGDVEEATTSAAAASAILAGAAGLGQERLAIAIGIALLVLLVVAVLVIRRRRRGAPAPGSAGPYATLAADPAPTPSETAPESEGGPL